MLKGRLGLETARIPHADRSGLLWLSRGALTARDGTLSFERGPHVAANDPLEPGHYAISFQGVSMILLGPGSTVSHDALRLLARHGTALAAVGEDGVRASPHTRGWTRRRLPTDARRTGFPAHAGMELLALIERTPAVRDTVASRKPLKNNGL